jgi:hypothetical protein
MRNILVMFGVVMLAACSPSAKEKNFPVLPDELKDCKFYRLEDGVAAAITVARCGNTTTVRRHESKSNPTTITIDGAEHERK